MKTILILLSSILTLASVVPYAIEVVRGKTKPRVVSWFTWSLLTGISCAASYSDKQYATGILLTLATLETAVVVVLGLKHGDRRFERFDVVCQVAAVVGLGLWLAFDSPAIAVAANVLIDLVGALPTLKHAWQKPHEETALAFALASLGALCTFLAADSRKVTAIAYPLYIVVANVALVAIIVGRAKRAIATSPAEFRDL